MAQNFLENLSTTSGDIFLWFFFVFFPCAFESDVRRICKKKVGEKENVVF